MAELHYCWRCGIEVPMLYESEWQALHPHLAHAVDEIKRYRAQHGATLQDTPVSSFHRPALDCYFALTGYRESDFSALPHHRLSLYGTPCGHCGKLLRTPKAQFCAECGEAHA